jgi:hypothetical protein
MLPESGKKKSPDPANAAKSGDAVFHPRCFAKAPNPRGATQLFLFRSSGFRIVLLTAPSHPFGQWQSAVFVPGYGGGSATDFNRLPYRIFRIRLLQIIRDASQANFNIIDPLR